jgi:CubicO group peptidase (beta-lactamase class C family)
MRLGALSLSLILPGCRAQTPPACPEPEEPARGSDGGLPSQDAAPALATRVEQADALARRARETFRVPGLAVSVVVGDEVVLARGYGERERGVGPSVDAQTSFAIASNTKAFTATAVGLLVDDGVLGWDDRVTQHIPELELWDPYVTRELRIRDLLSHRVGTATWAGDLMWLSSNYDTTTVIERLRHLPAQSGMRERYGYSNLMFMLAGEVIRRKTGKPWDVLVRTRILDPLGMHEVATRVGQLEGRENVAKAHIEQDGTWSTTPYLNLETVGAAASLHANVTDLAQWVRVQLHDGELGGQRVVPEAVIRETRQPHMWLRVGPDDLLEPGRHFSGYGLGWYLSDYRGELMVTHGGGMPGMISRVMLFPDADVGVVVLTSSESGAAYALALALADVFLTEPGETTKDYLAAVAERADAAQTKPDEAPPALSKAPPIALTKHLGGRWNNPMLGSAVVTTHDGETWFEVPDHGGLRCQFFANPSGTDDTLPCRWADPNMGISEFRLDRRGTSRKVRAMAFRVRPDFYDPLEYAFTR